MELFREIKELSMTLFGTFYIFQTIDDNNREAVISWLEDRSRFHIWLSTVITGTLVLLASILKPYKITGVVAVITNIGYLLLFFSLLANMVCIWTIPNWKYSVKMGLIKKGSFMRLDLSFVAWIGVVLFLAGVFFISFAIVSLM